MPIQTITRDEAISALRELLVAVRSADRETLFRRWRFDIWVFARDGLGVPEEFGYRIEEFADAAAAKPGSFGIEFHELLHDLLNYGLGTKEFKVFRSGSFPLEVFIIACIIEPLACSVALQQFWKEFEPTLAEDGASPSVASQQRLASLCILLYRVKIPIGREILGEMVRSSSPRLQRVGSYYLRTRNLFKRPPWPAPANCDEPDLGTKGDQR